MIRTRSRPTTDADAARDFPRLIALTPPDVLWTALYGFPPDDPMFRELYTRDAARTVSLMLGDSGLGGLPIVASAHDSIWRLPPRFEQDALDAASAGLLRALDLGASDTTAAAGLEWDGRDVFDFVGGSSPAYVQHDSLSSGLRMLLDLPDWWSAPKCPIALVNRPDDLLWRIGAIVPDLDVLAWRAGRAMTESMRMAPDADDLLLDGEWGVPFRAVLGPSPRGYARRIAQARCNGYFERSAASWLAATAGDRFHTLFGGAATTATRRQWSGSSRAGLSACCLRISGSLLGALLERVVISGPFEPSGGTATLSFVRTRTGGIGDPLAAFMTAAARGGEL